MDKQPSFEDRVALMRDVAHALRGHAELIDAEADRMQAAVLRFAARKSPRRETTMASR